MWAEIQINKQFEMALMATAYGGLQINYEISMDSTLMHQCS